MFKGKVVLASKSPRRQELIKNLGLDFDIRTKEVEEIYPSSLLPSEVPSFLAKLKAQPLIDTLVQNEVLLTSDTVVILENKVLGKPNDLEHAKQMIRNLSGKSHEVVTGVHLESQKHSVTFTVSTQVFLKELNEEEVEYYVENYKPLDKAGAYGIQEWIGQIGVEKIEGSYYNVVGLPVARVWKELTNNQW